MQLYSGPAELWLHGFGIQRPAGSDERADEKAAAEDAEVGEALQVGIVRDVLILLPWLELQLWKFQKT